MPVLVVTEIGEHDDQRERLDSLDVFQDLEAVRARHGNIKDHYLRLKPLDPVDGSESIVGFAHDLYFAEFGE